jgi:signal transduction histidine kinase
VPLTLSFVISVYHTGDQAREASIRLAEAQMQKNAEVLSNYFQEALLQVESLSVHPAIQSMDYHNFDSFLKKRLKASNSFEKFIVADAEGHFFNTAGGNLYRNGYRTFDDSLKDSEYRSVANRDYWQQTVALNYSAAHVVYLSDPMISYTTAEKQIVAASTVLNDEGDVLGLVAGSLPWRDIAQRLDGIKKTLERELSLESKLMLVSHTGSYWYHWDNNKIVQYALDNQGKPILSSFGEKTSITRRIIDEPDPFLSETGKAMVSGQSGYVHITIDGNDSFMFYQQIPSAKYVIAMVVPVSSLLTPVSDLTVKLSYLFLSALILAVIVSWFLSNHLAFPIVQMGHYLRKTLTTGRKKQSFLLSGGDELSDLSESINTALTQLDALQIRCQKLDRLNSLLGQGEQGATWEWQPDAGIVTYTQGWLSIVGLESDDYKGPPFDWNHSLLHPDDCERVLDLLKQFQLGVVDHLQTTYRMRHKDGHWVTIFSRAYAERDVNGRAVHVYGNHEDISEVRNDELMQRRLTDNLEARVNERTADLVWTNDCLTKEISHRQEVEKALRDKALELERANEERSYFMASISYELRDSLNVVVGFSYKLLEQYRLLEQQAAEGSSMEILRTIYRNALDLSAIVDRVSDLVSIESDGLELERDLLTLNELCFELVEEFNLAYSRSLAGINTDTDEIAASRNSNNSPDHFSVKLPSVAVLVEADRKRLQHILKLLLRYLVHLHDAEEGTIHIALSESSAIDGEGFTQIDLLSADYDALSNESPCSKTIDQFGQEFNVGMSAALAIIKLHNGRLLFSSPKGGEVISAIHVILPYSRRRLIKSV